MHLFIKTCEWETVAYYGALEASTKVHHWVGSVTLNRTAGLYIISNMEKSVHAEYAFNRELIQLILIVKPGLILAAGYSNIQVDNSPRPKLQNLCAMY